MDPKPLPSMDEAQAQPDRWYELLWRALRPVVIVAASAVIVVGVLLGAAARVRERYLLPVSPGSQIYYEFVIPSGASVTRVAYLLEQAELVRSSTVFKYFVELMSKNTAVRAGTFKLSPGMSMQEILFVITQDDGIANVRNITIRPGMTVEDVANYLLKEGVLSETETFLSLCKTGEEFENYSLVRDLLDAGERAGRKYALEGFLAPDTYEIFVDASEKSIISKLLMQTDVVFSATRYDRMNELGLTVEEVLSLASIVEREARNPDFPKVAAVLHNRLKRNMALQVDSTLQYALGTNRLVLSAAELASSTLYNSYQNTGYPPSPISNPSRAAINAVLYPEESYLGSYYYFCTMDPEEGTLAFSRTLTEHERAVAQYRPLWIAYDRKNAS